LSILDEIIRDKRIEVAGRERSRPIEELRERARAVAPPRRLERALRGDGGAGRRAPFRVIAEVKKASPSKGIIRADFDPVAIATAYQRGGAAAISVLTDAKHFQGSLEHLEAVRAAVELPLLRKDFFIDLYQVWEARAAGADAILLILAAIPSDEELQRLAREAESLGMDVLWEVHEPDELRRLIPLRPKLVGINNRSLRTFEVTLETTRRLLPEVPGDALAVSESGFSRRDELETMREWGVHAFLIGESLMRAPDPGAALAELLRPAKEARA
jgi:indole-3-glycerol phosphate synthase